MQNEKYLIFVETGGEMESPDCSYLHYYICNGNTIEEALHNWHSQVEQYCKKNYRQYKSEKPHFTYKNNRWRESGYLLQIIKLNDTESDGQWKELKWM